MRDIAGAGQPVAAIAIVADDLTGAADTGAAFAGAGLSTLVTWATEDLVRAVRQAEAIAIDAGTRALEAAAAAASTAAIVGAVRAAGVEAIYKKSDSLLRGHVGAEAAAVLASWRDRAVAVAAFAFPDAGRTTLHGRQRAGELAGGVPISPLFEDAGLKTCAIDLEVVRGEGFEDRLSEAAERCGAIVCDAVSNTDLARIASAGGTLKVPVVWVGTGGLARAVAASMRGSETRARAGERVPRRGPMLIVSGSASRVAREQVARAIASGAAPVEVPAAILRHGATAEARSGAAADIRQLLDSGRDVVVFPTMPEREIDPAVARALGELVSPLAERVGGAALTGGDTATAVLRAWGTTGLRIVDEIEPGVPISISEGATRMPVVTKAGAFGSPDVLVKGRERLHTLLSEDETPSHKGATSVSE